jgi:hypothetical protein
MISNELAAFRAIATRVRANEALDKPVHTHQCANYPASLGQSRRMMRQAPNGGAPPGTAVAPPRQGVAPPATAAAPLPERGHPPARGGPSETRSSTPPSDLLGALPLRGIHRDLRVVIVRLLRNPRPSVGGGLAVEAHVPRVHGAHRVETPPERVGQEHVGCAEVAQDDARAIAAQMKRAPALGTRHHHGLGRPGICGTGSSGLAVGGEHGRVDG